MADLRYAAISGVMPKWRQYAHRAGCAVMCVLFGGMGVFNLRLLTAASEKAPRVFSFLFVIFAAVAITGMLRYLRHVISEFRYDGSTLEFRTVGSREPQILRLADIASIRDWKGKGGPMGYRLVCRDRRKLYLEYSVDNSTALVNRLRIDMP